MAIFEISNSGIKKVEETTFSQEGLRERGDLQRLLRENIGVISPDTMVIAEEYGNWEDSRRRIDLLALDKEANLVVIELKRTEDGGHMELQAIRYAAMISAMTFEQTVEAHSKFLEENGRNEDARASILEWLDWDEPDEDHFGQDVRIVLASADFSKELSSSVIWLNDRDLDIRCVRLKPYRFGDRTLVDVQQLIPLPEAADFQVQLKEKARRERSSRKGGPDFTRYDITIDGQTHPNMWKRNAIFLICKSLCENGVPPEEINQLMDWRSNRVWRDVPGNLDGQGFVEAATKYAVSHGTVFRKNRWQCSDEDLLHLDGKTYALSNQWGGDGWHRAMERLKEKYADHGIDYTPTNGAE